MLNAIGQPFPPGASKAQLIKDLRNKAKTAVLLRAPAGTIWADDPVAGTEGAATQHRYVMFRMPKEKDMVVFGRDVRDAKSDYDPQSGPDVTMGFSSTGTKAFRTITNALAQRGRLTQDTEVPFAVILDNKIEATPTISYQRTPSGIDGNAQITGLSTGEANRIALVLQSGSLPVTFNTLSQSQVSATLGKDSLREGLIAGIIGLLVVMIYLAFFYRLLGLVADLALLIYSAFFYGLILLIPITLTLPGIAGMILTIGVAADANVVIFERIKEEVRLGKTVRAAISSGYTKGFRTIVDANVVTLITAGVLFMAGTGSVKGFAFTLAVGVLVSMFTAVLATRAMLGVLSGFRWFNNAALMGASGQKVRWRADITGRRYLWFAISGCRRPDRRGLAGDEAAQPRHRLQGRHGHRGDVREARDARAGHLGARRGQQRPAQGRHRPGPQRSGRAARRATSSAASRSRLRPRRCSRRRSRASSRYSTPSSG